ncbi:MAG TPA: hypothetical protein VJ951_13490 [Bacteroidales bacterium]|nr:hypothetical protein [Bacteroidales bacterium]
MKKSILFLVSTISCSALLSQAWTYNKGESAFDGNYRTASVVGSSTDATYNRPLFVINNFENSVHFNVYLSNVGYFCDNVTLSIKFDNDPIIYKCDPNVSNKQGIASIESAYYYEDAKKKFVSKHELLEMMMKANFMYLRNSDDCDQSDLKFSLSGSTAAIKYVYGENLQKIEQALRKNAVKEETEKLKTEWVKSLNHGELIFLKKNPSSKYLAIFNEPDFGSGIKHKFYENDTARFLGTNGAFVNINYKDSIKGWIDQRWLFPLEN